MMQLSAMMVRALAGNPLTVLVLLMVERRPCSLAYIRRWTGMSDKPVHDAIDLLADMRVISQVGRYEYQIAAGVEQLPLMVPELEDGEAGMETCPTEPVDKPVDNCPPEEGLEDLGRNYSDLALNESMNESLTDLEDSLIDSCPSSEKIRAEDLAELGFYGHGITEMLRIDGLTMGEVRYHFEHAPSLGAALARIKKRQPIPGKRERDGPEERSKYISGEYAEFIKH